MPNDEKYQSLAERVERFNTTEPGQTGWQKTTDLVKDLWQEVQKLRKQLQER
jgi:hypothetical protein